MDTKYCYPDSDVLINKLNIRDNDKLSNVERELIAHRQKDLLVHPISGQFDLKHLQAIHKHLFQDLYSWAGEIRTVDIAKSNLFCLTQFIQSYADEIFGKLQFENYLIGLEKDEFVKRCAYYFCEINALHPFREGNGRSQREFIRELALNAGWIIDWYKINPEAMLEASIASFEGNTQTMEKIFSSAIKRVK